MCSSCIRRVSVPTVATSLRCVGSVPRSIIAAGISSAMPACMRPDKIIGVLLTLIKNTSVPR